MSEPDAGLSIWTLTTGEAGMRTQVRALAELVGGAVVEKVVHLRAPWRYLPFAPRAAALGVDAAGKPLAPPWPDLVISCGRRSGVVARAVKRASRGRTALVHVQDPRAGLADFDLVIAMGHDDVAAPNVIKVPTALNDVTPARLAQAAADWRYTLAHLGRPLTGVILGGPTRASPFGMSEGRRLLDRLVALRAQTGGGLAVVPSRRTPEEVVQMFKDHCRDAPGCWTWDRTGSNPYLGVLALADRLVVTGDSVSMVSEALATTHPVEVFAEELRKRHLGFLARLAEQGQIRLLDGEAVAMPKREGLNATADAAEQVRRMLAARSS